MRQGEGGRQRKMRALFLRSTPQFGSMVLIIGMCIGVAAAEDPLASFIVEPAAEIDALKASIDGVYEYASLSGLQPLFNETSGEWGIKTLQYDYNFDFLTIFRTVDSLPGGPFVWREEIDRESYEVNGTITPAIFEANDANSTVPISSETLCLWSPGGRDSTSVYLRCANTHGNSLITDFYVKNIKDGAIQTIEGHTVEPTDARSMLLENFGPERDDIDGGVFLTLYEKVAQLE